MSTEEYSDSSFWGKVKSSALQAGSEVIENALWLYYTAQRSDTAAWAKAVIYGALAYFIAPIDAIPDTIPVIGYFDDLGAISSAIRMVSLYINEDVKKQVQVMANFRVGLCNLPIIQAQ